MRKDIYLDELIQILEEEKKLLKRTVKEQLEEGEYSVAHKYSKGLAEVERKLHVLYHFRDPYKDIREVLEREKKPLLDMLEKSKYNEFLTDYYLDLLNRLKKELGPVPDELEPFEDSQHIDDAFFDLTWGEIQSFKLVFTDEKLEMRFERQDGNMLTWSIGPVKVMRKSRVVTKKGRRALENMGFSWDAEGDRYVYQYDLSTFKDALAIKTLIARLVYDIFQRWYPRKTTMVELHREVKKE